MSLMGASVTFGLVTVPVNVETVASEKNITFKTLHDKCGTPIKQNKVCPACSAEDQVDMSTCKGFEISKGVYVHVTEDELTGVASSKSRDIKITKFVPGSTFEPLLINKTYYLAPNETIYAPYALLATTMEEKDLFALGKASLWGKEAPVVISAKDLLLCLHVLHTADEMADTVKMQAQIMKFAVKPEEKLLASMIVDGMTGELTEEDLTSESRQRVLSYIEAKANDMALPEPIVVVDPEPTVDLLATLRESMTQVAA